MRSSSGSIDITFFFKFKFIGSESLKDISRSQVFVIAFLFDHHSKVFKGFVNRSKQLPDNQMICDIWSTKRYKLGGESDTTKFLSCGQQEAFLLASSSEMKEAFASWTREHQESDLIRHLPRQPNHELSHCDSQQQL